MSELRNIFNKLKSYEEYLQKYPFHKRLGVDLKKYGDIKKKIIKKPSENIQKSSEKLFPSELDDLTRLHYLIITRKVVTIMEFGVGKSSIVFDHALQQNKKKNEKYIIKHLRRSNKFECHTIDNSKKYINIYKKNYKTNNLFFHYCVCNVSTYNGKICTFFDNIPNICPDFIYIDGPDQFSPRGDVRGLNTNHPDRVPMSADLLAIEHFLLPGTLIVLDGRTANARFLKSNFQRQWNHWHSQEFDQHFFELSEEPLGILNKNQIDFCLGTEFYDRLRKFKKIE